MKVRLGLALLLLLLLPSAAAAKGMNGPVWVSWNGAPPANTPVGGTWVAAFSLVQGPGGFYYEKPIHPRLVVTDKRSGATRRIAAVSDGAANTFVARVRFEHAGAYEVAIAGFDPRRPKALDRWGPVRIGSAVGAAADDGTGSWPWILGALGVLGALGGGFVALLRARGRAGAQTSARCG